MTKRRVARFCTTARSFGRDHIFSYRIKRKELRDWKAIGCLLASTLLLGESPDTRQSKHPNQNCRDQRDSDERQQIVTAKIPFDGGHSQEIGRREQDKRPCRGRNPAQN